MYEEVEYETNVRFEPLTSGRTLKEAELQSGDIIVFQTLPLGAAVDPPRRRRPPTPPKGPVLEMEPSRC